AGYRAEAAGQQGARDAGEVADLLEAEPAQGGDYVLREPQRLHRQLRDARRLGSGRGDAVLAVPRQRMRRPRRVGDGGLRGYAVLGQPRFELSQQIGLATPEMGAAGDVEPEPVGAVGRGEGSHAVAPACEALERSAVGSRVAVD